MSPQEHRILAEYSGVGVDDVARLENLAPFAIRELREQHDCAPDSGVPLSAPARTPAPARGRVSFDDVDRIMRSNRAAL